jgi:transposase
LAPPPDDHECGWRDVAKELQSKLDLVAAEMAALKRQVLGPKSEKMPPLEREVRRGKKADPVETQRKRRERALAKEKLVATREVLPVPDMQRCCPHCHSKNLRPVGDGKETTIYDYVPGYFRRRVFARETLACPCGDYIVTAPCPDKTTDRTRYAPSFVAHLAVAKCDDAIPLYRLEKQYQRIGIPIARSTMTDLFHRNAAVLAPLVRRLLARIAASDIVLADETSIRMQGTTKRAFLWTFLSGNDIAYVFSPDRSGQTPVEVLGGTKGTLLVDAYTGYNKVTVADGRTRAGCLAHVRRKFFEAKESVPEAQTALDLIRDIYVVEHEAREQRLVGTDQHLALRRTRTRPLLAQLFRLLRKHRGRHPPKSPMGKAIRYALKNHRALTRFTGNPRIPPDNNRSESALRVVALGRKNFLFVGNEDAGDNIAGLYSLIATCKAYGKNPLEYLTDVLTRIGSHPQSKIDELLPERWQPAAS